MELKFLLLIIVVWVEALCLLINLSTRESLLPSISILEDLRKKGKVTGSLAMVHGRSEDQEEGSYRNQPSYGSSEEQVESYIKPSYGRSEDQEEGSYRKPSYGRRNDDDDDGEQHRNRSGSGDDVEGNYGRKKYGGNDSDDDEEKKQHRYKHHHQRRRDEDDD